MSAGALGKVYADGEVIVRQGETGDCMFTLQEGRLEVVIQQPGRGEVRVGIMEQGAIFGARFVELDAAIDYFIKRREKFAYSRNGDGGIDLIYRGNKFDVKTSILYQQKPWEYYHLWVRHKEYSPIIFMSEPWQPSGMMCQNIAIW